MVDTPSAPPVAITLDVSSLDVSCRFYAELLGYGVVETERAGLIYERRTLRSALAPFLELRLRAAFGKRPIGSTPGSMLATTVRVGDVRATVSRLTTPVRWVGAAPADGPLPRALIADPDGYVVELVV